MSILSLDEFKLTFDTERVMQLASDYDEVSGAVVYDGHIVDVILAQAEDFVKAALTKQYTVAELEADKLVERLVASIAMYYLEFRRNQITPDVQGAFERAQRTIRALQDGEFKLGAVAQLLPIGNTNEPTEVLELGDGFFKLTDDESDLLNST